MNESLTGVDLPTYIVFEGGEVAYCESIGGAGSDQFILTDLDDRGLLNTEIQPHGNGEKVYITILSPNHNLMRAAVLLAQKYQGLVGLDASKPATCVAGEAYVATDTDKIYRCFSANVWTQVNYDDHGDLSNRSADDHTSYHTDGRADTWHAGQSGVHIPGGDDHDHYSSGEGSAAIRVEGGLNANKPTGPSVDAEIYFSTDLDGGTLFIGNSGVWEKVGGVPEGAILAFNLTACPSGWTRYAALDDKYPRGGQVTEAGNTGGSWTHVHGYSVIREHYHVVNEVTGVTSSSDAGSNHEKTVKYGAPSSGGVAYSGNCSQSGGWSEAGAHTHTCTIAGHNTDNEGVASGAETASATNKPVSLRIMWCQKD
jgi:hypothetical protein